MGHRKHHQRHHSSRRLQFPTQQPPTKVGKIKEASKKVSGVVSKIGGGMIKAHQYISKPETQKRLGQLKHMGENVDRQGENLSRLILGD